MATSYDMNLIKDYEYWTVYLYESQRYLGRLYIALKREGDIDPFTETTTEERSELEHIMYAVRQALTNLFNPTRLNYDNLRNTWHHCHWHVVPRYDSPREVHNVTFVDENVGKNWPPYNQFAITTELHQRIKNDIANAL